jgi:photosystem II stability/assembly factor-like uncharacterized protein
MFSCGSLFGQQWQFRGLGNELIRTLVVDQHDPNLLYAGTGSNFSEGTNGRIFKSTDGGMNWDTVFCCIDIIKLVMHPDSSSVIYAAIGGANLNVGGVIKTTDAGINWFRADSGIFLAPFVSVDAIEIDWSNPQTLYAGTVSVDWPTGIYKTANSGNSWLKLPDTTHYSDGPVAVIAIDPKNSNTIYMGAGSNPAVLKSTDGGESWKLTGLVTSGYGINEIKLLNSQTIYAAVDTTLMRSMDGGDSWIQIGPNIGFCAVSGINPLDITDIYFASCQGIWKTSDGGNSWHQFNSGLTDMSAYTLVRSNSKLYVGTNHGVFGTDITASIGDDIKLVPSEVTLYQNYPDPFNPVTHFQFTIHNLQFVSLKVFDVLGNEVATLVNGAKPPGSYEAKWDASDMASGVYLYRLQAGRFSQTKKMLLLR